MSQWPSTRILDLLGIELPIIQGPMAGATTSAMVIAVCNAGGLGSMPAAMLSIEQLREELKTIRQHTQRPFNVNYFCHQPPPPDEQRARDWKNPAGTVLPGIGRRLRRTDAGVQSCAVR
jgi:Dioxygenases related to 2-nitropropane dioxygenase